MLNEKDRVFLDYLADRQLRQMEELITRLDFALSKLQAALDTIMRVQLEKS